MTARALCNASKEMTFLICGASRGFGVAFCCRHLSSTASLGKQENIMNVFDRKAKRIQKNRTALMENYTVFEYIREEV